MAQVAYFWEKRAMSSAEVPLPNPLSGPKRWGESFLINESAPCSNWSALRAVRSAPSPPGPEAANADPAMVIANPAASTELSTCLDTDAVFSCSHITRINTPHIKKKHKLPFMPIPIPTSEKQKASVHFTYLGVAGCDSHDTALVHGANGSKLRLWRTERCRGGQLAGAHWRGHHCCRSHCCCSCHDRCAR
jgi:hypothetical protein